MFCSECGAKNLDEAKFCEECGAILEENNGVKNEKENIAKSSNSVNITKKQKSLIIMIIVIIAIIFAIYKSISVMLSPQKIVEDYIQAINSKEYDVLYEIAGFSEDTTFITKEQFKNVIDNALGDNPISNYNIGDEISYENGNLTANVPVNIVSDYMQQSVTVKLTKLQEKKLLFFDNWKVSNMSSLINYTIVKDFKISVPKGTKVNFAGIDVNSQYLDDENSNENEDVYILPQVLSYETLAKFELSNGVKIEKKINKMYSGYYSLEISIDDFSDEEKEKIKNLLKNDITSLVNLAAQNKSFDEAKKDFPYLTTDIMKNNYENEAKYLENLRYSISDFNITDVKFKSISLNTENDLSVSFSIDYSWKATVKENGNSKNETETEFLTCIYNFSNDGYNIENLKSFPSVYVYIY